MNTVSWDIVKEFYQKEFGIDNWVVEMYANMDILCLCVSGASNASIEEFLEIPIPEIVKVLQDAFDFGGWDKDLPLNPYKIFCSYKGTISSVQHFADFVDEVGTELAKYLDFSLSHTDKMFYMCETMYDIESKIKDEWI